MNSPSDIKDRVSFSLVRYANCWEDSWILCRALEPAPGKRFLSIASGGDNCFALLANGAKVVAADLSASQLACVELKAEAVRILEYDDILKFLGVRADDKREQTYRSLAPRLSAGARSYWDAHMAYIRQGIVHCGKFENFFQMFRKYIMPLIHSRKVIADLVREKSRTDREKFYDEVWNNFRWRLLFKLFMSRSSMGRLGRDPEFFRYVEGSVSDRILHRAELAMKSLPLHRSPYLDYILNGNYTYALPYYLEPGNVDRLRKHLDGLTLYQGFIQESEAVAGNVKYDGFNLSDIFEYLDADTCRAVYGKLLGQAAAKARFAYWNMLVPRRCPAELAGKVLYLSDLSDALFKDDLAFFYSAFVVEEVR